MLNNAYSIDSFFKTEDGYKELEITAEELETTDEKIENKVEFENFIDDIIEAVWNTRMKTTKKELKNILVLYSENYNDYEIARVTGIARKTIYDHRVRFKNYLQKNGY